MVNWAPIIHRQTQIVLTCQVTSACRNAFGQTTWSQPFVKQIQADPEAEETEEKAAPVCSSLTTHS